MSVPHNLQHSKSKERLDEIDILRHGIHHFFTLVLFQITVQNLIFVFLRVSEKKLSFVQNWNRISV